VRCSLGRLAQVVVQIVNNDIYYAARRNRIHEGPEVLLPYASRPRALEGAGGAPPVAKSAP
jgi:hypothetical protein